MGGPFQPFEIHVCRTGVASTVRHPEFAVVSRDHVYVGVPSRTVPGVAERTHLISLQNITSASPLPAVDN